MMHENHMKGMKGVKGMSGESRKGPTDSKEAKGSSPGVGGGRIPNASWKGATANVVESRLNKGKW